MDISWFAFFTAALSGGVVAKLIDIAYELIRSNALQKRTAKNVVDLHLDPLLKAADEIVGKTRSLADRDFHVLIHESAKSTDDSLNSELLGIAYLYSQFWSRVEILRQESLAVSIVNDPRGAVLKDFLSCLQSQKIRLVDRAHQKAIGEIATYLDGNGKLRSIGIVEFASKFSTDKEAKEWLSPLLEILENIRLKTNRQKILVYGVAMHALIDTLDAEHHSTHKRPSYPNKLSKASRLDIKNRVFKLYLKQVRNKEKYVG